MIECLLTLFLLPGCTHPPPYRPSSEIIVPLPRERDPNIGHSNPQHRTPQEERDYVRPPLCPRRTCELSLVF
jgi:hypothetical protein